MDDEIKELLHDMHILHVEPSANGLIVCRWNQDKQKVETETYSMSLKEAKRCLDYYSAHIVRKDEVREKILHPSANRLIRAQRIEMRRRRKS